MKTKKSCDQETRAAQELASSPDVSPHKLISLLMSGLLERSTQARASLEKNDRDAELILLGKIIGIINGLRGCLDFDQGGEIAVNLDKLYEYMLSRIEHAESASEKIAVLEEVESLISEVKSGWDGLDEEAAA